jgi:pantetheine-phosphate adenylyltransferase
MAVVMYPGSFDPVTLGHVDIVTRAAAIFEKVIVAVYATPSKDLLFDSQERVDLFRGAVAHLHSVEVIKFTGLVVECARTIGANVIARGLRSGSDFEYEFEMAYMNRNLAPDIELVCFMASLPYQYVSSSLLKEVVGLGGDVSNLVPINVIEAVKKKLNLGS